MSFLCLGRNYLPRNLDDFADQNLVTAKTSSPLRPRHADERRRGGAVDRSVVSVVDEEPAVPGLQLSPRGATTAIVSTPGGLATFRRWRGGKRAFRPPTSCVAPPKNDEPVRDITTWPPAGCRAARGNDLLIDDTESCDSSHGIFACDPGNAAFACPLGPNLSCETRRPGRRKLAVAFPTSARSGSWTRRPFSRETPASSILADDRSIRCPFITICQRSRFRENSGRPRGPGVHVSGAAAERPEQTFSRSRGFAQLDDARTGSTASSWRIWTHP